MVSYNYSDGRAMSHSGRSNGGVAFGVRMRVLAVTSNPEWTMTQCACVARHMFAYIHVVGDSLSLGVSSVHHTRAHDRDKQNFLLILAALALQQTLFRHV